MQCLSVTINKYNNAMFSPHLELFTTQNNVRYVPTPYILPLLFCFLKPIVVATTVILCVLEFIVCSCNVVMLFSRYIIKLACTAKNNAYFGKHTRDCGR